MRRLCRQNIPNLQFSAKIRTNKDDWHFHATSFWCQIYVCSISDLIYLTLIFSSIYQSCVALYCSYFVLFKMRIFAKYVDILRLLIPFVLKPTTCNSDQTVAGTLKFGVKIDLAHFKAILGHSLKLSKINIEDLVQRNRT